MLKILINATAAKESGALTVLKDCITYLGKNPKKEKEIHLFTVVDEFDNCNYIKVHKLKKQKWLNRIIWDNYGLQKWCRKNNLEPDVIISMQNTSIKYKNKKGMMIKQIIYYHQTIPLYTWKGIKKNYIILFYQYFYPFFVNMNNKKSHYIVQLPFIKYLFCKKFKEIKQNHVTVIRPNQPYINISAVAKKDFSTEENIYKYIYPATPLNYKNHEVLISALIKIKNENPDIIKKIVLYFTVNKLSKQLMKKIKMNNIEMCIRFIGQVPYTTLLSYYKSVDALLFPSKIESFGLPLLEASCFGLPIIACNLPYAREVLEDYSNKYFIDPDNEAAWAKAIKDYKIYKNIVPDKVNNSENSWKVFFNLVDKLVME